jgi:hypothetical protein
MKITKGFLLSSILSIFGFAENGTTIKCFQPVRADLYASVSVPAGSYKRLIGRDQVYRLLVAQGTADKSSEIAPIQTLLNGVPNLPLSAQLKRKLTAAYNDRIKALKNDEREAAITNCIYSIKPQRSAAMTVPEPNIFKFLGNIWEGEGFSTPHKALSDCNGLRNRRGVCRKASDLK